MNDAKKNLKLHITQSMIMVFTVMAIIFVAFCSNAFSQPSENPEGTEIQIVNQVVEETKAESIKYALIAAAAAFGLSAVGAGIAISHVGAAAMGAVAEKPQIANWALIFIALGEGIVIFGFIIAVIILGKIQ
ncbi:MAG: hypothetical protein JW787_17060 [Sedimentisphaerales bacterium]|nr:hypothetical protein [Sedimentisphaerales bacterium]